MLSKEDLLQELELLPVWQLRNPAPKAAKPTTPGVVEEAVDPKPEQVEAVRTVEVDEQVPLAEPVLTRSFRLVTSDDGLWAFVLDAEQTDEAETLFQNMLKAVSVTISQDTAEANTSLLKQGLSKVIVVMGEEEAQQLLSDPQTLEAFRGEVQHYQNIPVVVTYTPSQLLMHSQDKAKAWEDLCLAKLTIANL
jgi:hypothetical protein